MMLKEQIIMYFGKKDGIYKDCVDIACYFIQQFGCDWQQHVEGRI